jgi:hypothetical protein
MKRVVVIAVEANEDESVLELTNSVELSLHMMDLQAAGKAVPVRKVIGYEAPKVFTNIETLASWLEQRPSFGLEDVEPTETEADPPGKTPLSAALVHLLLTNPVLTDYAGNTQDISFIYFDSDDAALKAEMLQEGLIEIVQENKYTLTDQGAALHVQIREIALKWRLAIQLMDAPCEELGDDYQLFERRKFVDSEMFEKILQGIDRDDPEGYQHKNGQWYYGILIGFPEDRDGLVNIYEPATKSFTGRFVPRNTPVGNLILSDDYNPETGTCYVSVRKDFINELRSFCGWM